MKLTAAQQKYFAYWLTRSLPSDSLGILTASLQDAQVDLTPHQIDAALFAFKSPLSKGAILADEVDPGKTIEAGIILSQFWAEHRRHLLIIAPANLRKQWAAELQEKFFLPSRILEAKTFNHYIEDGNLNPFNCEEIVICSYQFAKTKAPYLKQPNWDLVVIDEAHRLRNVYKPTNKISNTIKNTLADRKKILHTATPLQNSILELYGLTNIIDNYAFGDLKSFKMQYNRNLDEIDHANLRRRLAPLCKRTLRRQVLEYVRYTKRIAILQEFFPTKQEQELYDLVSEYLQRLCLYALPNSQCQLMTLILRKLLASSTHAIYETLCALIDKLETKLKRQGVEQSEEELFKYDYEDYESETDEWLDDGLYVNNPAIAKARNFKKDNFTPDEIEIIKLEDGITCHERTKLAIQMYAKQNDLPVVKPFILVACKDIGHAKEIEEKLQSDRIYHGAYKGKVLRIDSDSKKDEEIERQFVALESPDNEIEIVVNVNMLKEGWDVNNLYTIIPLRASNAAILIEQTIGRGLRLPYGGQRTGNKDVDTLTVINKTKDLNKVCEVYCKLGYCQYDNRNSNEDYLISFMNNWVEFSTQRGVSEEKAQLMLLMEFDDIDTQEDIPIFDHKNKLGIWSFFPFRLDNVEKLVDFIIKFDDFESEEFKVRVGLIESKEDENSNSFFWNDEAPRCALLCNFYVYIFNKLNNTTPHSAFAVCVYTKWLTENQSVICRYLGELSSSEISSSILDYAIEKYSEITTIPNGFEAESSYSWNKTHQDEEVIELLYKLYYHTIISDYELVDLWVYIVVNRALSYRKFQTFETSPILQVAASYYVEDGEIMLPWKYVRFVDGKAFFYHPNHEKGKNGKLPYKLEFDKVQKNFMEISKAIRWNFPFIKCSVENWKIINIDIAFAKYVITELAYLCKILSKRSSYNTRFPSTAQEILLRYKSQQFDCLKQRQLEGVDIIPINEKISYSSLERQEPGLLFATAKNQKTWTLIYESTCIARATYIFIVDRKHYQNAVNRIQSFFTSDKINKRAELQFSRDIFSRNDGFLRVIRVLHDDNKSWVSAIKFYSK